MKTKVAIFSALAAFLLSSCMVAVNNPDQSSSDDSHAPAHQQFTRATSACFPFQDNSNWWHYTEAGGNTTTIHVTDTISDNNILYHKVSFRENRVDTTDDWFKKTTGGIYFSRSLISGYTLFIPAKIDSMHGTFESGSSTVTYSYYDSLSIDGVLFYGVLHAEYSFPLLHGFDEITFADSIGIIRLIDHTGRWPISYTIDSCSVSGTVKRF